MNSRVYFFVTSVQGCLMAAVQTTCEAAMADAVEMVEAESETTLLCSLDERYETARRFMDGQSEQMEIIASPIFGATECHGSGT